MSRLSSIISALRPAGESAVPPSRLERVNRMHRRRIDDVIEDAFQHACMTGDLETAIELADLLERKLERWQRKHGAGHRNGSVQLAAMRAEILIRQEDQDKEIEIKPD